VPFGAQIHSTVTDHYLYLPMLGAALGAAWLAAQFPPRMALAVAVPLLLILAARSWFQARHWRDTMTLFQHNLTINPNSAVAHTNVGFAALVAGNAQLAEHHTRAALRLRPSDAGLYKNLGIALGQQNRLDEASDALREAIRLDPSDEDAKQWLARIPAR
jgi:tetratricopeptide (TPR) repeat protein